MEWLAVRPAALAAAVALGILWLLESLWPFFVQRKDRDWHGARNLMLGALNGAVRATFFPAALLVATSLSREHGFGLFHRLSIPAWSQAALAVLALDLAGYGWHVACHQWRFLWRFHAVHHHDDAVDATTAFRFHMGDVLIGSMVTLVAAVILGLSMFHVLLYEAILVPLSIFHHGNMRLPKRLDDALAWIIVTPRMHWVHHSRWVEETDSNYSGIFSFWDRLFGTLRTREDPHRLRLGLDGYETADHATLRGCLLTPFGSVKSLPGRDTRVGKARRRAGTLPACSNRTDPITNPG